MQPERDLHRYTGGCHCGAVRFDVQLPAQLTVQRCNCSMCEKSGFLHVIVPAQCFKLRGGENHLQNYAFNTGVARHLFCKTCGIKSFYVPRSNPDGYSINLRCLDQAASIEARIETFDGRHWSEHAGQLKHLSEA